MIVSKIVSNFYLDDPRAINDPAAPAQESLRNIEFFLKKTLRER